MDIYRPVIPYLSLMWPVKTKELPTPDLKRIWNFVFIVFLLEKSTFLMKFEGIFHIIKEKFELKTTAIFLTLYTRKFKININFWKLMKNITFKGLIRMRHFDAQYCDKKILR